MASAASFDLASAAGATECAADTAAMEAGSPTALTLFQQSLGPMGDHLGGACPRSLPPTDTDHAQLPRVESRAHTPREWEAAWLRFLDENPDTLPDAASWGSLTSLVALENLQNSDLEAAEDGSNTAFSTPGTAPSTGPPQATVTSEGPPQFAPSVKRETDVGISKKRKACPRGKSARGKSARTVSERFVFKRYPFHWLFTSE
jgi:hypothetical protein